MYLSVYLLPGTLDDFDEDAPVPEQNVQVAGNIIHLDDDAGGYTCEDQILVRFDITSNAPKHEDFDRTFGRI